MPEFQPSYPEIYLAGDGGAAPGSGTSLSASPPTDDDDVDIDLTTEDIIDHDAPHSRLTGCDDMSTQAEPQVVYECEVEKWTRRMRRMARWQRARR